MATPDESPSWRMMFLTWHACGNAFDCTSVNVAAATGPANSAGGRQQKHARESSTKLLRTMDSDGMRVDRWFQPRSTLARVRLRAPQGFREPVPPSAQSGRARAASAALRVRSRTGRH